jgi:hypothetical protein
VCWKRLVLGIGHHLVTGNSLSSCEGDYVMLDLVSAPFWNAIIFGAIGWGMEYIYQELL